MAEQRRQFRAGALGHLAVVGFGMNGAIGIVIAAGRGARRDTVFAVGRLQGHVVSFPTLMMLEID
jgi:hypothetical protein